MKNNSILEYYKARARLTQSIDDLDALVEEASEEIEDNNEYIEFYEFCMDIVRR